MDLIFIENEIGEHESTCGEYSIKKENDGFILTIFKGTKNEMTTMVMPSLHYAKGMAKYYKNL